MDSSERDKKHTTKKSTNNTHSNSFKYIFELVKQGKA
jgi:hypothetical protein